MYSLSHNFWNMWNAKVAGWKNVATFHFFKIRHLRRANASRVYSNIYAICKVSSNVHFTKVCLFTVHEMRWRIKSVFWQWGRKCHLKIPKCKIGPWGNKQRSNKPFMHFAKMPGFSHDMLLKDVQLSCSSPRETLSAGKLLQKAVGADSSPAMSFSCNMNITTWFENLMANKVRAGEEICR